MFIESLFKKIKGEYKKPEMVVLHDYIPYTKTEVFHKKGKYKRNYKGDLYIFFGKHTSLEKKIDVIETLFIKKEKKRYKKNEIK